MLPKVLVIVGPTAAGKSDLAVKLAREYSGEVISADSRQVYRGFDLTSGKITKREMHGIPHHMLSVASPRKTYSVDLYKKEAQKHLKNILSREKLPIITGGTGLYVDTLIYHSNFPEVKPNLVLRKKLEKLSTEKLFIILEKLDSRRAKTIDAKNPRRLIRAVEIAEALGEVPRVALEAPRALNALWIGINPGLEKLKKRIRARILKRIKLGLINEIKKLHESGLSWRRLENFGLEYKYISLYLQKKISKDEMLLKLESETFKYAKRQMTWFKRNKSIKWFKDGSDKQIRKLVEKFI